MEKKYRLVINKVSETDWRLTGSCWVPEIGWSIDGETLTFKSKVELLEWIANNQAL